MNKEIFCTVHNSDFPCIYCEVEIAARKAGVSLEDYKKLSVDEREKLAHSGDFDTAAIAKAKEEMDKCECNYHLGMGPNLKCPIHGSEYTSTIEKIDVSEYVDKQSIGRALRGKSKEELLIIRRASILQIESRIYGMVAENSKYASREDNYIPYDEDSFMECSNEIGKIIETIRNG